MGTTEENQKESIDEKPPNPVGTEEENRKIRSFPSPGGYAEEELKDPYFGEKPPKLDEKTRRKTEKDQSIKNLQPSGRLVEENQKTVAALNFLAPTFN